MLPQPRSRGATEDAAAPCCIPSVNLRREIRREPRTSGGLRWRRAPSRAPPPTGSRSAPAVRRPRCRAVLAKKPPTLIRVKPRRPRARRADKRHFRASREAPCSTRPTARRACVFATASTSASPFTFRLVDDHHNPCPSCNLCDRRFDFVPGRHAHGSVGYSIGRG